MKGPVFPPQDLIYPVGQWAEAVQGGLDRNAAPAPVFHECAGPKRWGRFRISGGLPLRLPVGPLLSRANQKRARHLGAAVFVSLNCCASESSVMLPVIVPGCFFFPCPEGCASTKFSS